MSEFTIVYRGVPLGIGVTERPYGMPHPGAEGLPPRPLQIFCEEFRPLAAYEAFARILQLATRAHSNFGFVGPAADPASALAGRAAQSEARQLCDEFEVLDSEGRPTNGRVIWFLDGYSPFGERVDQRYLLHIELSESGAAVAARLQQPPHEGGSYKMPPRQ